MMSERAAIPPITPPAIAPTGVEEEDCEAEGSEEGGGVTETADACSPLGVVKGGGVADASDLGCEDAETEMIVFGSVVSMLV